jgi:hypothetical protein
MKNPKRVETFAERQKIRGETAQIGRHYVCGCGNNTWILLTNGDCVCSACLRAQVRIMVNEIAPVSPAPTTVNDTPQNREGEHE